MKKRILKNLRLVVLLLLASGAVGCSSLPKVEEPRSLDFARMKMRLGRDAQQRCDYERAVIFYREAYDFFTRIDDIKGKIESSLSMARQYFYLDRAAEKDLWLNRASELIDNNMPDMAGAKAVLSVEMAFAGGNFQKVVDIVEGINTEDLEWRAELLCMAMVSGAKLKQDYWPWFRRVLSLLPDLEKRFKKGKIEDAGVLSLVYYYSGYIYSIEGKWREAAHYFEQARTVDSRIDNTYGLGNDLFALARCYEKLGLAFRSKDSYRRASEIFELLGDKEMLEKLKKNHR